MNMLNRHFVHARWWGLGAVIAAMVLLYAMGAVGMAYVAGYGAIRARLVAAHCGCWPPRAQA